ncbi:MAG: DEAD/DEAH box helicase [Cyanobacteria bacterium P01_H01_bin.74]
MTNPTLTVSDFQQQLVFSLDEFQTEAMAHIQNGASVVVCAPTGSGKTIIAEYAAMRAISEGKRLFYTTPLKALSNQKYFDLKATYGEDNVGLLTGDSSVNRSARIVVMTTEIFRNMLYGQKEDSSTLDHLGYVVLDECHYMNDSDRGTVWEESIVYCPDSIQLIALSATIANAAELTDWINEVHHDTRLVSSSFRPVPLRFLFAESQRLLPLFESPGKLNKKLKLKIKGQRAPKKFRGGFQPIDLIQQMADKAMLPAIVFTFSRKDCDKYLELTKPLQLLTAEERQAANRLIDDYLLTHPFLVDNKTIACLRNGFGSHHAGLLPAVKGLVELLFQAGLMKAVFATETLAAGINMPARTTVITKISKRTNDGHRMLTASEFLQMSGRAGRRGMDKVGYVVIVSSQYEGAREAAHLASSDAEPLNSQFTPTYGMVLNLLKQNDLEQAEFLIRQSFGQFTSARRLKPLEDEKTERTEKLNHLESFVCPANISDSAFHAFIRSRDLQFETRRFIKILEKQIKNNGKSPQIEAQLAHEQGKLNSLKTSTQSSPCNQCDLLRKHIRIDEQLGRVKRKLKVLTAALGEEQDTYWQQFLNLYRLLKESGCIDANDQPTALGELTAQLRTENEYAMAAILSEEGLFDALEPPDLAAVLSALLNDNTRENLYVRMPVSPAARDTLVNTERIHKKIKHLQRKHKVTIPVTLNPISSPLLSCWVQGYSWQQLIALTNIGEGDIVRQLRRVADILRQIIRLDQLPSSIVIKARQALNALDREPIKEVNAIVVSEKEQQATDSSDNKQGIALNQDQNSEKTGPPTPEKNSMKPMPKKLFVTQKKPPILPGVPSQPRENDIT